MLRRAGGSERERGRARGGGFPLRSGKDATFFLGWGPLLSGWEGGREGGREEYPFLGANEVAFAVLTAACAACAVLSCVNAERGGKLGRHGGEQRT